jgi:hypothetical protein
MKSGQRAKSGYKNYLACFYDVSNQISTRNQHLPKTKKSGTAFKNAGSGADFGEIFGDFGRDGA